jgi:hypothetical protein
MASSTAAPAALAVGPDDGRGERCVLDFGLVVAWGRDTACVGFGVGFGVGRGVGGGVGLGVGGGVNSGFVGTGVGSGVGVGLGLRVDFAACTSTMLPWPLTAPALAVAATPKPTVSASATAADASQIRGRFDIDPRSRTMPLATVPVGYP